MIKFKSCILLLFSIGLTLIQAQNATISTGGNAIGTDGSVSYSIGQSNYITNRSNTGSVNQGIQQPFEISIISGLEQAESILLECLVYPNPTTDFLRLKLQDYNAANLSYMVYDINGVQLISKKVTGAETEISLQGQEHGMYFLKVIQSQGANSQNEIKVFKIIKN